MTQTRDSKNATAMDADYITQEELDIGLAQRGLA
jgi:hypothetical protein